MADRVTVDFDHHDPAWHAGRVEHWAELRQCPVAFNERHGGFWVVSGPTRSPPCPATPRPTQPAPA